MYKDTTTASHPANYMLLTVDLPRPRALLPSKKDLSLNVLAMLKKSGKVYYEHRNNTVRTIGARKSIDKTIKGLHNVICDILYINISLIEYLSKV